MYPTWPLQPGSSHSVAPRKQFEVRFWLQHQRENSRNSIWFRAMITEFGGGSNTECLQAVSDLIQYMADNDVYIGWSIWAAGPSKYLLGLRVHKITMGTVWGTASPCCGADNGSLEPGQENDLGGSKYIDIVLVQPLLLTICLSALSKLSGHRQWGLTYLVVRLLDC